MERVYRELCKEHETRYLRVRNPRIRAKRETPEVLSLCVAAGPEEQLVREKKEDTKEQPL